MGVTVLFKMPFELPVYLKYLRLLRAFRVFRLFKRIKSLNKIIVSLGKAVPGVSNAFLILLLVMAIYAILGVELFSQLPCGVNNRDGPNSCVSMNGWMAEGYHLYGLQDSTCTGTPTAGTVCTDFSTYNNWDKTQANCPAGCVYTADGWGMDGRFKWGGGVGRRRRPARGRPAGAHVRQGGGARLWHRQGVPDPVPLRPGVLGQLHEVALHAVPSVDGRELVRGGC